MVNGQAVSAVAGVVLQPGDLVDFSGVQARVVAVEKASASPTPRRPEPVDDASATRVRMAVPKFVLRGVSGAAFGKTYPVASHQVIGRQADCDISIPSEEISRRHASVRPTPIGLQVEDMGSSNGTYINGKRVQEGLLRPGEELRLDNIRFLLVAPGVEIPSVSKLAKTDAPAASKVSLTPIWIGVAVLALGLAAAAAWYLLSP
jgi:pSer/pThr/pTyr-binding forkhead associated (FHA) protein